MIAPRAAKTGGNVAQYYFGGSAWLLGTIPGRMATTGGVGRPCTPAKINAHRYYFGSRVSWAICSFTGCGGSRHRVGWSGPGTGGRLPTAHGIGVVAQVEL